MGVFSLLCISYRRKAKIFDQKYGAPMTFDWREQPLFWRKDIEFARKVIPFLSRENHFRMFEDMPALCQERQVWELILKPSRRENGRFLELIRQHAPEQIVSDKELMKTACATSRWSFYAMSSSLNEDIRFIEELLNEYPKLYGPVAFQFATNLPHVSNLKRPAIIGILKQCFLMYATKGCPFEDYEALHGCEVDELAETIGEKEWNHEDRAIRRAWFEAGLPFIDYHTDPSLGLLTDKEVFLIIAEYCAPEMKEGAFRYSKRELRSDKIFMMKVLAKDPNLISCITYNRRTLELMNFYKSETDYFDLATFAFAISPAVVRNCMGKIKNTKAGSELVRKHQRYLQERIGVQDSFLQTISVVDDINDHSLWQVIGEFVGTPTTTHRFLMERALVNLDKYSSAA